MFKFLLIVSAMNVNMITTNAGQLTIGVYSKDFQINGSEFESLQICLCSKQETCTENIEPFNGNIQFTYDIQRAQPSYTNTALILLYACQFKNMYSSSPLISCDKKEIKLSCSNQENAVIFIPCPEDPTYSAPLVWDYSQSATLYSSHGVDLQTCQQLILATSVPPPTTTALTTTESTTTTAPTTVSATSVKSSSTSSATSTVKKDNEDPEQPYTTADTPYDTLAPFVRDETPSLHSAPETSSSYHTTTYMDSAVANSGQDSNSAGFHLTEQHIGIIVGTALGAVVLTILIIVFIWRLKALRKQKREGEDSLHTKKNTEEQPHNAQHHQMPQIAQNPDKKKTNVKSSLNNTADKDQIRASLEHYTYIDNLPSSPSTTISITNHSAPKETPETHYYSIAKDCQQDAPTTNSILPALKSSNEPNSIPISLSGENKLKPQDDIHINHLKTAPHSTQLFQDHHYLDAIAASQITNDSTSLYSTLGDKTVVKEHPYNRLSHESSVATAGYPSFSLTDSNPALEPNNSGSRTSLNSSLQYVTVVPQNSGLTSKKAWAINDSKPIVYSEIAYINTQIAKKDLEQPEIKPREGITGELQGSDTNAKTTSSDVSASDKNDNFAKENLETKQNLQYFNPTVPVSVQSESAAKPITEEITYANVC